MKFDTTKILWIVGILVVMSFIPGQGTKPVETQAIVNTEFPCSSDLDCPHCLGYGLSKPNATVLESELTFFNELSYAKCVSGKCKLTEYCIYWDCGTQPESLCKGVKQTVLDNTIGRFQENPIMGLGVIALIVMVLML